MNGRALIVCGPTAAGKTVLGLRLAKEFNGEVLSADSRQVYKGLDVLTGKDMGKARFRRVDFKGSQRDFTFGYYRLKGVRVWGLDIVDTKYLFNVSDYEKYAKAVISDMWARGKLPIVVGGTGLYIKVLLRRPETVDFPPDWVLRRRLEGLKVTDLQERLEKLDKTKFNKMNGSDKANPRRLIRAIEVTGHKTVYPIESVLSLSRSLIIGLTAKREVLKKRIDERLKGLMKNGAEREVRTLIRLGVSSRCPALSSTGAGPFLVKLGDGKRKLTSSENLEILQAWQLADHGLARRQMTWFRRQLPVEWFDIMDKFYPGKVLKRVRAWYN